MRTLSPSDEAILNSDLPIWIKAARLKMKQQELLAMLIAETGEDAPNATYKPREGDEATARGVPILGYVGGLGGAILGTRPDTVIESRRIERLLGKAA